MNDRMIKTTIAWIVTAGVGLACGALSPEVTTEYSATSTQSTDQSAPEVSSPIPQPQIDLRAGSYTNYRDIINSLWFVGEILNNGNVPAESIQVVLSLLDSSGNVIATGSDTLLYIEAGGKFPFHIFVDNAPQEWAEVKIQIQGQPFTSQSIFPPYLDLKVDKVTGQPSDFGNYGLTGLVTNTGQKTALLVHIVAVAYDADGNVIDVGDTYSTLDEIAPGGDSPFSLEFGNMKDAPASYEIYAQSSLTK